MWGCFFVAFYWGSRVEVQWIGEHWKLFWSKSRCFVKCPICNEYTRDRWHVASGHFVNKDADCWIFFIRVVIDLRVQAGYGQRFVGICRLGLVWRLKNKDQQLRFYSVLQKLDFCVDLSTSQGVCLVSCPLLFWLQWNLIPSRRKDMRGLVKKFYNPLFFPTTKHL
jgi:hypothetical protein